MNSNPTPSFSPSDFSQYFNGSYINYLDPAIGKRFPAKCVSTNDMGNGDASVALSIFPSLNIAQKTSQHVSMKKLMESWESFSWPQLGYVQMGKNVVCEVQRNQIKTQYKGLNAHVVKAEVVGQTYPFLIEKFGPDYLMQKMIFACDIGNDCPLPPNWEPCVIALWHSTYTPFETALDQLLTRKSLARAVSKDFCFVLNHDSDCEEFPVTLMFQGLELAKYRTNRSHLALQDATVPELKQLYLES